MDAIFAQLHIWKVQNRRVFTEDVQKIHRQRIWERFGRLLSGVLVTYPPTGILGKVAGGCWNTFEKYSFDSGLGKFCCFFWIAERRCVWNHCHYHYVQKSKSYTFRFYVNFLGWRLFVWVIVNQEWSCPDETASISDCLTGWAMVTSSMGGEGTEIDLRTYQWDVSKTKKPPNNKNYFYIHIFDDSKRMCFLSKPILL